MNNSHLSFELNSADLQKYYGKYQALEEKITNLFENNFVDIESRKKHWRRDKVLMILTNDYDEFFIEIIQWIDNPSFEKSDVAEYIVGLLELSEERLLYERVVAQKQRSLVNKIKIILTNKLMLGLKPFISDKSEYDVFSAKNPLIEYKKKKGGRPKDNDITELEIRIFLTSIQYKHSVAEFEFNLKKDGAKDIVSKVIEHVYRGFLSNEIQSIHEHLKSIKDKKKLFWTDVKDEHQQMLINECLYWLHEKREKPKK